MLQALATGSRRQVVIKGKEKGTGKEKEKAQVNGKFNGTTMGQGTGDVANAQRKILESPVCPQ